MSLYLIGDLQGCNAALQQLLQKIDFSPSRDTLYALGDLVNRGPDSLGVLHTLKSLGSSAQCLLGNHDLHLLAVWQGVRRPGRRDTLDAVLSAPDAYLLMEWLRHQPMAIAQHGWLMVHAGVLPQWSVAQTISLAGEVEHALRGHDLKDFLAAMYGNTPTQWHPALQGADRLRVIVNALTRLRFCTAAGDMEFAANGGEAAAPDGYRPWFEVPGRASAGVPIAFGHWSALAGRSGEAPALRRNTLGLDTGCVWGGCLSAARLAAAPGAFELIQVGCEPAAPFIQ